MDGPKEGSCRLAKTKTDSFSDPQGFMQGRAPYQNEAGGFGILGSTLRNLDLN